MGSGEAIAVALKALLQKAVSPEGALQALLSRYPKLMDALERIEENLAFERSVFHQYGRPGDLEVHREHVAPLERAREEVLEGLRTGVLNSLRNAGFLAFGIRMPINEASRPEPIAPVLWNALELDFRNAIACGGDREYRNVRIVQLDRCAGAELALALALIRSLAAAREPRWTDQGTNDGPSFVGRRSLMRAIAQEMRRRAERGELCAKLAEECRMLAAWAREKFPGHQTPGAKAIENALRSLYRQLKPRETP